mmetsp:Transcript_9061/g.32077  ORF Transcript_9061/g.32077 Transcript_9061/m.32077 type:complete len:332 (+) Transcript_9061:72-1067(+)
MPSVFEFKTSVEYVQSNKEYLGYLVRPLNQVPLQQLLGCSSKDMSASFTEWSVLQVWVSAVTCVIGQALLAFSDGFVDFVDNFVLISLGYTAASYIVGHMGWFAVVKMNFQVPPITFLWGLLCICIGCGRLLNAIWLVGPGCKNCLINVVLQSLYSMMVMYMGMTSLFLRRSPRSPISPSSRRNLATSFADEAEAEAAAEAAAAAAACAEDVDVEVGAERATPTSEAVAPAFFAPAPTRDQVEGSLPTLLTSPNANVVGKAAGKDGAAKKASSDKAFEDGGAKKASSDKAFEDAGAKKASSDKAFQDAGAKKASSDKAFQEAAKTDTGLQL